ncbi:hypothetical protein BDA99DRAFT_543702 [Phascolomyces articulosus]|uniref:RRM domain-containing protein n=1 Tax=Phascolomyces articulosus TaxID=60185 RepID=A0AAD5JXG9_9FUNG|nr:hypothetical protein BDA99DRAFT_543702 [Phascolomyces articulosus]
MQQINKLKGFGSVTFNNYDDAQKIINGMPTSKSCLPKSIVSYYIRNFTTLIKHQKEYNKQSSICIAATITTTLIIYALLCVERNRNHRRYAIKIDSLGIAPKKPKLRVYSEHFPIGVLRWAIRYLTFSLQQIIATSKKPKL